MRDNGSLLIDLPETQSGHSGSISIDMAMVRDRNLSLVYRISMEIFLTFKVVFYVLHGMNGMTLDQSSIRYSLRRLPVVTALSIIGNTMPNGNMLFPALEKCGCIICPIQFEWVKRRLKRKRRQYYIHKYIIFKPYVYILYVWRPSQITDYIAH